MIDGNDIQEEMRAAIAELNHLSYELRASAKKANALISNPLIFEMIEVAEPSMRSFQNMSAELQRYSELCGVMAKEYERINDELHMTCVYAPPSPHIF